MFLTLDSLRSMELIAPDDFIVVKCDENNEILVTAEVGKLDSTELFLYGSAPIKRIEPGEVWDRLALVITIRNVKGQKPCSNH